MVGVPQDDLCLNVFAKFLLMNPFYRSCCTNRHEYRCFDGSVIRMQAAEPCLCGCICMKFFEVHKRVDKNTTQRYSYLRSHPIFAYLN